MLYLCRLPGAYIWITRCGAVYDFFQWDAEKLRDRHSHDWLASGEEAPNVCRTAHVIQMELIGSRSDARPTGIAPLAGYHNYIIGNDSARWASFVPLYQEVRLRGIYEGIDIRYYFEEGRLRFDFVVEPGADPSQIQFRFHGQFDDMLAGDKSNQILLSTQLGDIATADLRCYQHEQHIESHFVRERDAYQIALGPYNPALALVIDAFFSVFDPWTGSNPCPLPIRLLSFSADCEREGTVSIRWETAAETHADHFQIEHSTDMRAWQQIAMVSARYPIGGRYEYLHFGKAPRAFYRLRMVDTDGSYTFSSIVEVETARCLSTESSLTVYPHPTTGAFTLYSSTGGEFMLLDAAGQVLRHYTLLPGEAHLCDEKLPAGIYFVRSISDNQVQKLVVSGE